MPPEGHHYSQAMAFGLPAAQPVVFVRLVPHLLSAKVEGDGCHLVCCGHIILVAAAYPSMLSHVGVGLLQSFTCQCESPLLFS